MFEEKKKKIMFSESNVYKINKIVSLPSRTKFKLHLLGNSFSNIILQGIL